MLRPHLTNILLANVYKDFGPSALQVSICSANDMKKLTANLALTLNSHLTNKIWFHLSIFDLNTSLPVNSNDNDLVNDISYYKLGNYININSISFSKS